MARNTAGPIVSGLLAFSALCLLIGASLLINSTLPGRKSSALVPVSREVIAQRRWPGILFLELGAGTGVVALLILGASHLGVGKVQSHAVKLTERYQSNDEGMRDFGPDLLPGYSTWARLQFEDGSVEDVTVDAAVYPTLRPGQYGIALLRGGRLVRFLPPK
jgi:hypothetical protein